MRRTKVLVVDDHSLFRRGIRDIIEREPDIEVVGEAESEMEAILQAKELEPDLILMDITMPHGNGLEAISTLKRELPDIKVIILTVHAQDEYLFEAIKRGVEGFLSKNVRIDVLLDSIRAVMRGEAAISGKMTRKVLKEYSRLAQVKAGSVTNELTPREKQVLCKLGKGLSNKDISLALEISENTVKVHINHIFAKLHIDNRSQAAAYARDRGM